MPMYNLIEYNSSYSETTGRLWFYSKDEAINFDADIANNNNFKCFEYKAKLLEITIEQVAPNETNGVLKTEIFAVPLKYLSNFWRSPEMLLINCKVKLKLKWTRQCVLSADGNGNDNDNKCNNITFILKNKNYMFLL